MDAGGQERRANEDEERNVKDEEVMLWDLEKTQFLSCQLPPLPQTSIQILAQAEASGHALPALPLGPHRLPPTDAKPPHLLPQASPQEGHAEASTRSPHCLR